MRIKAIIALVEQWEISSCSTQNAAAFLTSDTVSFPNPHFSLLQSKLFSNLWKWVFSVTGERIFFTVCE